MTTRNTHCSWIGFAIAWLLTFGLGVPARAQALPGSNATGVYDPANYGAVPHTDATAQIQAAATAASAAGGTVQISQSYYTTGGITSTNCNIVQTSRSASIQYYPKAGITAPAWTIAGNTGRGMTVDGLQINGPGGTALGGNLTCVDGIAVTGGPVKFRDCSLGRFRAAFNVANIGGHVYFDNCDVSASYYDAWFANNAGDYHMTDCRLSALFACLGYGASGLTIQCDKCAIGFSPFAVYQVATDPAHAGGLFHCQFTDCSFEAVGNECIYSEYARLKPCATIVNTTDLIMSACGITFLGLYQLPGYPHDYAIEMDAPESEIVIDGGIYPVPALTLGAIYAAHPTANANRFSLTWRGASPAAVCVPASQKTPVLTVQGAM